MREHLAGFVLMSFAQKMNDPKLRGIYAGLHQFTMCSFRSDRLLRRNALSSVQMGFEIYFAGERELSIAQTGS